MCRLAESKKELGNQQYKAKQYGKALSFYTEAISKYCYAIKSHTHSVRSFSLNSVGIMYRISSPNLSLQKA